MKTEPYKLKITGTTDDNHLPWMPNPDIDPDYPWGCYRNDAGVVVYWIPQEAPTDIPVDNSQGAKKRIYSTLPLFGGKSLRVCWDELPDRQWAFDQKRWIDAEAKRNERRVKRETLVEEVLGDGSSEKNPKKEWSLLDESSNDETLGTLEPEDEANSKPDVQKETSEETEYALDAAMEKWEPIDVPDDQKEEGPEKETKRRKRICDYAPYRFPQTEPQAITLIELETVTKLIMEKNPRWWRAFYMKEWEGLGREEIAAKLDVNPSRVYQLIDAAQKLAQQYRRENR